MPAPPFVRSVWALVCCAVQVLCLEFISAILAALAIWAVIFSFEFRCSFGLSPGVVCRPVLLESCYVWLANWAGFACFLLLFLGRLPRLGLLGRFPALPYHPWQLCCLDYVKISVLF